MPSNSRSYSGATLKILFYFGSGRCPFPSCNVRLVEPATLQDDVAVICDIAHIHGLNRGSARYDPTIPVEQLNSHQNLILLCPTHHRLVDKQGSTFTASEVRKWKDDDLRRREQQIRAEIATIQFAELETVATAISQWQPSYDVSFELVSLQEKIKLNELSPEAERHIVIGLNAQSQVEKYLTFRAGLEPDFPEKIKGGFLTRYIDLISSGDLSGDEVFAEMVEFTVNANGRATPIIEAARIAVLVYFFEKCDIFKR